MSRSRVLLVAVAFVVVCGCYRSVPLATPEPVSGSHIAALLSDSGSAALAQYLGPNVTRVGGRLLTYSSDDLQISVATVAFRNGDEGFWKGEMVTLPRRFVARIEERKLSGSRSGLVAGLGLLAGVGFLRAFGVLSAGSGSSGGSTNTK